MAEPGEALDTGSSSQRYAVLPTVLSQDTLNLTTEIHAALDAEAWWFVVEAESDDKTRLFKAACLRHAAQLLTELDVADNSQLEFSARMVARTLFETLTLCLYLHFFDETGYGLVVSNFRSHVKETRDALKKVNEEITRDADGVGDPREKTTDVKVLDDLLKKLGDNNEKLGMKKMAQGITAQARMTGAFRTNFAQEYSYYRIQSITGPHTNYRVLRGYVGTTSDTEGARAPTYKTSQDQSPTPGNRVNCLRLAATVSEMVLKACGISAPAAHEIVQRYNKSAGFSD